MTKYVAENVGEILIENPKKRRVAISNKAGNETLLEDDTSKPAAAAAAAAPATHQDGDKTVTSPSDTDETESAATLDSDMDACLVSKLRCSDEDLGFPGKDGPAIQVDKGGYFQLVHGALLTPRYRTLYVLGSGSFGKAIACLDTKKLDVCALKISRATKSYRKAAMQEIEIISTMMEGDSEGLHKFGRMQHWFEYTGVKGAKHVVIVFDLQGDSLLDTITMNKNRPFEIDVVRDCMKHIFQTLEYVHGMGIIHTDVKAENIMHPLCSGSTVNESQMTYVHPGDRKVILIDYGSAVFGGGTYSDLITSRYYRAPEVILGTGWSFECDVWSCGCVLMELVLGRALFNVRDDRSHLAMMETVLGNPMPEFLAHEHRQCKTSEDVLLMPDSTRVDYSTRYTCPFCQKASCKCSKIVNKAVPLETYFESYGKLVQQGGNQVKDLLSVARACLTWNPSERPSCSEILKYPFFSQHNTCR